MQYCSNSFYRLIQPCLERLLMSIRNYCLAVTFKDWREIGDEHLKIHFIFEWFGADEGIHVRVADHPLMVDCGHGILFTVHAKWV
jgi:hypothetical protein